MKRGIRLQVQLILLTLVSTAIILNLAALHPPYAPLAQPALVATGLDATTVEALAQTPGVETVAVVHVKVAPIQATRDGVELKTEMRLVGGDLSALAGLLDPPLALAQGRLAKGMDEIVLGAALARGLGMSVGSEIPLAGRNLRVVGVAAPTDTGLDMLAYGTEATLAALGGAPQVYLRVMPDRVAAVREAIAAKGGQVVTDPFGTETLAATVRRYRMVGLLISGLLILLGVYKAAAAYADGSLLRARLRQAAVGALQPLLIGMGLGLALGAQVARVINRMAALLGGPTQVIRPSPYGVGGTVLLLVLLATVALMLAARPRSVVGG